MNFRARIASIVVLLAALPAGLMAQVTLKEDNRSYILDNGIVTATILKRNGDLYSLQYKGLEMLEHSSGHAGAYWSHDTTGGKELIVKVTTDPSTNGGERAEVSIKGISGGIKMGHGPGAQPDGDFPADIEIRWSLGKGDSGLHTYCIFDHLPEYPAATMTEARFCAKLAKMFDWMSVAESPHHNKAYPATLREGDKYVYTTNQYKNPAFGWSSIEQKVGFFIINPSNEYMSGGPTKTEFLGHRDTTAVAAPCVLNYWRSSHYGGAEVAVAAGEHWTKVIGPFMVYVNSGANPQEIYADAKAQAAKQQQNWPYTFVTHPAFPTKEQRSMVSGQLMLTDPQRAETKVPNLLVGLTIPEFPSAAGGPMGGRIVDWQVDAKNYQFWVRGSEDGTFKIPNVRPGTYVLRAFGDGVLGELAKADIKVESGKTIDLGKITWTPVRKGKQLWEIGYPNRNGSEFFLAENYWQPAAPRAYAELFPNDINYTIGKSDFRKDWYFAHVPHFQPAPVPAPVAAPPTTVPAGPMGRGGRGPGVGFGPPASMGREAPRTITFDLPSAPKGKVTLRVALSGTAVPAIGVTVNDRPAGQVTRLRNDGAIARHAIQGLWYERELAIDATLLKQGTNTLTLTVPGGNVNNGVIYDYLRFELDENAVVIAQ